MRGGRRRDGWIAPGHPVVERTGESTGASPAWVCLAQGHPLTHVTNEAVAQEARPQGAPGAEVEVMRTTDGKVHRGSCSMRARVEEIVVTIAVDTSLECLAGDLNRF